MKQNRNNLEKRVAKSVRIFNEFHIAHQNILRVAEFMYAA